MNVSDHNLDIEENERVARAVVCYPDDEPNPRKELNINTAEQRPVPSEEIKTGPSVTLEQRAVLERLIDEYNDFDSEDSDEDSDRDGREVWSKTGGNGEPWPSGLGHDDPGVVPQRDSGSDGPGQPAYAALEWERRSTGLDTDFDCEL
ncbi:hypothetical protein HPB47_027821 [Ixodes persulcatus]|uniref:Uncharacterized protein n=1 Tax=Ixodes persulcatus TaxID=34615 RepID=A0AC60PUX2_IXOPE|nr:hypothetical protein HPB47_027821 [Ixodes persulcatus]